MTDVPGVSAGVELSRIISGESHSPVVYFARMGIDHIKIGTSANLTARMQAFYLGLRDVLLIVPGGHAVEARYHSRFAALGVGGRRRELFRFAGDLKVFLTSATSRDLAVFHARRNDPEPELAAPELPVIAGRPLTLPPPNWVTIRESAAAGMLPRTWTKPGGAFRTAKHRAAKEGIPVPPVRGKKGSEAMYDAVELADFLERITSKERQAA